MLVCEYGACADASNYKFQLKFKLSALILDTSNRKITQLDTTFSMKKSVYRTEKNLFRNIIKFIYVPLYE